MIESRIGISQDTRPAADRILTEKVDHALLSNESLKGIIYDEVKVACTAGTVRLEGYVDTVLDKHRATDAVQQVPDVLQIENELVIDADLIYRIAELLAHDSRMDGEQIGVNAQQGFVYLFGEASTATARKSASEIVAEVPTVRGIVNHIHVAGEETEAAQEKAEDRILQPAIGIEIFATDDTIGHLQKVVIDQNSRRVKALVVAAHFPSLTAQPSVWQNAEDIQTKRTVVVPISAIRDSLNSAIFLTIDRQHAAHFADIDPALYQSPPDNWQPPYPYQSADVVVMPV